jgi:hypothetical protein
MEINRVISYKNPEEINIAQFKKWISVLSDYDDILADYLNEWLKDFDSELYITSVSCEYNNIFYEIHGIECWPGDQPRCCIFYNNDLIFDYYESALNIMTDSNDPFILHLIERKSNIENLFKI